MKRINLFVLCSLLCASLGAQERIMVIADPHVLPQSVIAKEANFDDYMAKQRKMVDLSEPIWNALMDTAMKYHPDLLLIPGDLTRDGEPEAHALVSNSLAQLAQAGIPSIVVPGNHDKTDWFTPSAQEPIEGLTVLSFYDGVDVNWLAQQADAAITKGNTVIAMTHRQLVDHFDGKSTLEPSARLTNADAVRDCLMAHGVHLVLTGHFHVNSISTWRDSITGDSLVELSTGSPITYPCPYRWLTLSPDRSQISVQTEYLTAVDTIKDLYTYSRDWMVEHTENMIPTLAVRAWNKVDSKWDSSIAPMLKKVGLNDITINYIHDNLMPSTDKARIDITRRHLGDAAVNLYLFHSEANEFEYPEKGQELADAVYTGMNGIIDECFGIMAQMVAPMKVMAVEMAKGPVQSLVEDMTQRDSERYANITDDLHPVLTIGVPQQHEDIDQVPEDTLRPAYKLLRHGQLIIRHNNRLYNAQGIRLQ
jgi:UDP-2,3-diacylglucosamine pyrophosphatase LpxH